MLEMRPSCEHCAKALPNDSDQAMICTFECTFCVSCVETVLFNVCPNCGGGFERRPSRPKAMLAKHPPSPDAVHAPVVANRFLDAQRDVDPRER